MFRADPWQCGIGGRDSAAISYIYYGQLPDIHGIALVALFLKMAYSAGGLILSAVILRFQQTWPEQRLHVAWSGLMLLAVTALMAAAFLRWFS